MTGVGAATRIARPGWGDTAMVIGCGAVGLSAVQGCVLAGCGEIVAVDPNPARRQLAQAIGATRAVAPDEAEAPPDTAEAPEIEAVETEAAPDSADEPPSEVVPATPDP